MVLLLFNLCFSLDPLSVCLLVFEIEGLVERSYSAIYTSVSYYKACMLSASFVEAIYMYKVR
jgi:hypothetical protein